MLKHFRRYMVAGILVWLPIGVTVFLLRILIGLMDRTLLLLPEQYRPENLFGFSVPGLGFVLTILVLLFSFFRPIHLLILRVSLPTCTSLSHGFSFAAILSIGIDLRSAWSF